VELSLDEQDAQLLRDVLQTVISDLSPEIADTDNPSYRRELRSRRDALRALLAKLGPDATAGH
jgi:hypothetical protein